MSIWIGFWSSNILDLSNSTYIGYYSLIAIGSGVTLCLRGLMFGIFARTTANNLFYNMLYSLLRSPLTWFDVTPSGRILNRTNKD